MSLRHIFAQKRFVLLFSLCSALTVVADPGASRAIAQEAAAPSPIPASPTNTPATNSPAGAPAPAESDPRSDVKATIKLIVAALEAPSPDYVKFIRDFADPVSVAELEKTGTMEQVGKLFGEKRAALVLTHMKSLVDKAPLEPTSEDVAIFSVVPPKEGELASRDKVSFRKIKGRWYIVN